MHSKRHFRFYRSEAFSLAELLMGLALMGVLAMLGLRLLLTAPKDVWPRVIEDYSRQLSAVYNKIKLENGDTPLNALNNNNETPLYADGIATLLQTWESTTVYTAATPANLQYPSGIVVYVHPEEPGALQDTNSELPRHQAGALTPDAPPGDTSSPETIMAGTSDREWLLVDVNGSAAPNSLGINGDRVLLIVDDATGRVLTAWQKCWMTRNPSATNPYGDSSKTACTLDTPTYASPSRTYYKSFYDVYKDYTGSY